jgi:hypothetical protein
VKYALHPDAELELDAAVIYYAEYASHMIASAFLAEYERIRDLLIENQQRGPYGDDGLRLYHFDRFPYSVVYEENELRGPQIFAIAHQSREPKGISINAFFGMKWRLSNGAVPGYGE